MPATPSPRDVCARVAEILRRERLTRNLSLTRVAEGAALSRQAIAYFERGQRIPTLDTLLRIAGVLDVDLADVIREATRTA